MNIGLELVTLMGCYDMFPPHYVTQRLLPVFVARTEARLSSIRNSYYGPNHMHQQVEGAVHLYRQALAEGRLLAVTDLKLGVSPDHSKVKMEYSDFGCHPVSVTMRTDLSQYDAAQSIVRAQDHMQFPFVYLHDGTKRHQLWPTEVNVQRLQQIVAPEVAQAVHLMLIAVQNHGSEVDRKNVSRMLIKSLTGLVKDFSITEGTGALVSVLTVGTRHHTIAVSTAPIEGEIKWPYE